MRVVNLFGPKICFCLLAVMLYACEEQVDWPLTPGESGRLVVDAILTNEFKQQSIYLSENFLAQEGRALPIEQALVQLRGAGGQVLFDPVREEPGHYLSIFPFAIDKDQRYELQIRWQDQTYQAEAQLSFVTPLPPITFESLAGPDSLQLTLLGSPYHPLEQSMYEVHVDWRHLNPAGPNRAKLFFYTFSTVDGSQIFLPPREKVYFPAGSQVIVKKFGLSPDFAQYLRSIALETTWQGGLFDVSASNPTSNIDGALGYFALCAVVSDTLVAR